MALPVGGVRTGINRFGFIASRDGKHFLVTRPVTDSSLRAPVNVLLKERGVVAAAAALSRCLHRAELFDSERKSSGITRARAAFKRAKIRGMQRRSMIEAPLLVTARLRLRMLQAEDFEAYAAIHSDVDVTRFTTRSPLTREEAWKHMATIVGHWHLRGYGMWGVEEMATKKLVGRVGYHCPEGWPEFELGWTIGREFWGSGFATEAARAALDYAFEVMKRDHIISLIDPDNARSIAVAERLGETLEGETEIGGYRLLVYGISR